MQGTATPLLMPNTVDHRTCTCLTDSSIFDLTLKLRGVINTGRSQKRLDYLKSPITFGGVVAEGLETAYRRSMVSLT